MKSFTLSLFIFFLFVNDLHAQSYTPTFYKITNAEGLSQASCNVVFKDSEGFLWIGTDDGLNRYDGKHLVAWYNNYKDSTTLAANEIYGICEDKKGRIWVAHYNSGISCFDKQTTKFKRISTAGNNGYKLSSMRVYGIFCDRNGIIWARSVLGISRIDPENFKVQNFDNPAFEDALTANVDIAETDKYLWFGGKEHGLLRILKNGTPAPFTQWNTQTFGESVFGIYPLSAGELLVTSEKGLFKLYATNNDFQIDPLILDSVLFDRSSKLFKERDGNKVWIATDVNGILIVDISTRKILKQIKSRSINDNLISNTVFDLFEDEEHNIFIATDRGINRYSPYSSIFNNYENCFKKIENFGHPVYAIYELPDKHLLIGSKYSGGYYFNPETQEIKPFQSRSIADAGKLCIFKFTEWVNNRILVSTTKGVKGISVFNDNAVLADLPEYPELKHLDTLSVTGILKANDSIGWISTMRNGLFKWNFTNHTLKNYKKNDVVPSSGPVDNQILVLGFTTENDLMICTKFGFSIYYTKEDSFLNIIPGSNFKTQLAARNIKNAYDDGKNIWLSTYGAGVQKFNKTTRTFTSLTTQEGLPNNAVYAVIPDAKGNIWISTNNGLAAIDKRSGKINIYTIHDGLPDNEFNAYAGYRSNSGTIFYSTLNGIVSLNPDNISSNNFLPNVVLTGFSANNGETDSVLNTYRNNSFSLPAGFTSLHLKFAALSYAAPEKIMYKVKLEGFDKNWLFLDNETEIRYSKLAPGNYIFQVMASNNNGAWNKNIFNFKIHILPFWYQTWWFKISVTTLILAVIFGFLQYRKNEKAKVEKFRKKISSDLHDDIGSTLSSINIYSELAKKDKDNQGYLATIQQHTQTIITNLDDLVWSINPKNDFGESLVERMRSFAVPLLEAKEIQWTFDYEHDRTSGSPALTQRNDLYLIFKELINNVVKHSHCTTCLIYIRQKGREFYMEVKDNGKGFNLKTGSNRNGLKNIHDRIKKNKGSIEIITAPDEGCLTRIRTTMN